MKSLLGVTSALIIIAGTLPYIDGIFKNKVKPSRMSWALVFMTMVVSIFIQGELGSGWARLLTLGEILTTFVVTILAIKYGRSGSRKQEIFYLSLWALTVLVWIFLDRPLLAMHVGICADLVSMLPTFLKIWKFPDEESISVFVACSFSGFLAIFAARSYEYGAIIFPAYLFLVNAFTATLIIYSSRLYRVTPSL